MNAITNTIRETLLRLIRKEFDAIDRTLDWVNNDSENLINTAKALGLNQLADEMENDRRFGNDI